MEDKKIAEFNYKLLNNILCNNLYLSKWNSQVNKKCKVCQNDTENIRHLIFDCKNVQKIWNAISDFVTFQVQWKHVIIGFYSSQSNTIKMYNLLFSFISYKIYKHKMYCRLENTEETEQSLFYAVKDSVLIYSNVLKYMCKTCDGIFFKNYI